MEFSLRTCTVSQIITFSLIASISECLINSPAYYIQTDEGPNRFFQFSSGPGGQFRRETLLPNGTVVGAYSWRDGRGLTRIYSYMADSRGYRVTQHTTATTKTNSQHTDHQISPHVDNHLASDDDNHQDDDDVGRFRNSNKLRLRRKVLVKRQKSDRPRVSKSVLVGVKKLGLGAEIIPYQPTLLLSSQYPGRNNQMRLVGDDGIVTVSKVNINKKDDETDHNSIATTEKETEDQLPTSVLLQRIRVGGEKEKVGRRKGRMVRRRRRRRRKNHVQEETLEAGKDVAREQRVYFTPL